MFRHLISAAKIAIRPAILSNQLVFKNVNNPRLVSEVDKRCISSLIQPKLTTSLLLNPKVQQIGQNVISRSVTKYSFRKGKRKTVKTVLKRFYRLAWGGWVRTMCGRHKKLWKKSPPRKRRLRQHVLCNATQSTLLDKMVNQYWRKPKYYVEDPYEPYHTREEFKYTAIKPRPYFPPEN